MVCSCLYSCICHMYKLLRNEYHRTCSFTLKTVVVWKCFICVYSLKLNIFLDFFLFSLGIIKWFCNIVKIVKIGELWIWTADHACWPHQWMTLCHNHIFLAWLFAGHNNTNNQGLLDPVFKPVKYSKPNCETNIFKMFFVFCLQAL